MEYDVRDHFTDPKKIDQVVVIENADGYFSLDFKIDGTFFPQMVKGVKVLYATKFGAIESGKQIRDQIRGGKQSNLSNVVEIIHV